MELDLSLVLQIAQVGGGVFGAGGALYVLPSTWKGYTLSILYNGRYSLRQRFSPWEKDAIVSE